MPRQDTRLSWPAKTPETIEIDYCSGWNIRTVKIFLDNYCVRHFMYFSPLTKIRFLIEIFFFFIEKQNPFDFIQKSNSKDKHTCSFSSQRVPHITVEVIISRQEKAAWLAEGDTCDAADDVVVAIHAQLLVRPDVKHSTRGVITSGGKSVAIRKELKKNEIINRYDA